MNEYGGGPCRPKITAWSNLASTCRAEGCPHRQVAGSGTKARPTPSGDPYAALQSEAVGIGAKDPHLAYQGKQESPASSPGLPAPPQDSSQQVLLTWNLRCWPGVLTRVQQPSHSMTRTERKRQENNTHRGSPERLSQGQAGLSGLQPHPAAPRPAQPTGTHRDMQLKKSFSSWSSDSTLALLGFTRVLALLTLSKGPRGSGRWGAT